MGRVGWVARAVAANQFNIQHSQFKISGMNRLGVLGTLIWDRIWRREVLDAGGEPHEGWGGIAYSLCGLSAARPEGWEVVPLIKIGRDLEDAARRFLDTVPGLSLGPGVHGVEQPNNRVELRYHDAARRCEQLTGGVPPWRWAELAPHVADLDALYLNFISGFEMELCELERLRAGFRGPIYADVHSLLLGRDAQGRRVLRPLAEAERWLRCFDAIQVNEDELATLAAGDLPPMSFAKSALRQGPGLVLVTLGEQGASYVMDSAFPSYPLRWSSWRSHAPHPAAVRSGHVAVPGGSAAGDPTGCGDVWGSVMLASLLTGLAVPDAIRTAHRAAARKVEHSGVDGLPAHLREELHTA
jgi:hypothetical protein